MILARLLKELRIYQKSLKIKIMNDKLEELILAYGRIVIILNNLWLKNQNSEIAPKISAKIDVYIGVIKDLKDILKI